MKNFLNGTLIAGAQATTASLFAVGTIVVSLGQADNMFRPLDRNWSDWMDRPAGHTECYDWSKSPRTEKKSETA
ncbi:hypothetical protein [Labrenzia sp. PHM005]|uniref:hypothetical protein n=1 Tax=Labrenzia sp. PHM005 TaxID=2590016 RepID=UPI00143CE546|nr:hypothetical protein [Labrenzia sp. PHM005]